VGCVAVLQPGHRDNHGQQQANAIGIEDLDFTDGKTRERHGRRRRFRQLISGMPTGRLKARLVSMAAELGLAIVAVDPAYTSLWGAQHWQNP
jgi:IS605 OrfB family transposase